MIKKKETIISKIKWKVFMLKIRFDLWLNDIKYSLLKNNHCNKGFHYFEKTSTTLTSYHNKKKRTVKSNYFKCKVCGLIRFTTKKDLKNYNIINKREDKNMRLLAKSILNDRKK